MAEKPMTDHTWQQIKEYAAGTRLEYQVEDFLDDLIAEVERLRAENERLQGDLDLANAHIGGQRREIEQLQSAT